VHCKSCGASWAPSERLLLGEVVQCDACQATLEVASLKPLELMPFRKVEETEDDFVGFDML